MAFLSKFSTVVLTLAAFTAANFTPSGSFAAPVQCNMSKAKINNLPGRSTTSDTPVTVASMNFIQGGAAGACVVVQFSAQAGVDPGGFLQINILLDDISQVSMNFADTEAASHSVTYPIASVLPGTHNIKVAMRSVGGENVTIQRYTLAIFYVP